MRSQTDTLGGEAPAEAPTEAPAASRSDPCSESSQEPLRPDVIADIARIARLLRGSLSPARGLTFTRYVQAGGHFPIGTIRLLGGWKSLCRAAGVQRAMRADADTAADVVADIVRVARQQIGVVTARGLPYHRYVEAGGRFTMNTMKNFGSWSSLCQAAGVQCGSRGGPKVARQWKKTGPARGSEAAKIDEALRELLGQEKTPRGILNMFGRKRRRGPLGCPRVLVTLDTPVLQREVIADIRDVSHRAGLASPRLLTWETYCSHGGLYRYDQIAALGGFDTLRRRSG
jgi:hypothetical protein